MFYQEALNLKIEEAEAKLKQCREESGNVTEEIFKAASAKIDKAMNEMKEDPKAFAAITPQDWAIISTHNAENNLARMKETADLNLITPHGKFVLVPESFEGLVSPSGFHPDERVFIQPEQGAIVPVLPKSSNMKAYDFTK